MGKVIEMFVIDEITGLPIPNVTRDREFFIVKDSLAYCICKTRNEAIARLREFPEGCWIEEF